jgi:hypothetical protein
LSDCGGTFGAKHYPLYLKEDERKTPPSEWMQYVIAAIFWPVKLKTSSLEKFNIKSECVIEKVTVE